MQVKDFNTAEKVLVLGAGQLGDAMLSALVPAVEKLNGSVTVIVSPGSWDEQGKLRSE
ncbi:TPA: aromatic alcohol reductase, partial [Klebsiella pneumoniae subsp. pneumoniae]|nr:aromatic alcohol reductase [Klebsiella pneumoniae subsp. pneumoniae]